MSGVIIAIVILALPFILGPIRRGIVPFLVSVFFLIIYILLFNFSERLTYFMEYEVGIYFPYIISIQILILVTVVTTFIVYFTEKRNQEEENEYFYDDRLFRRYGYFIRKELVPISLKGDHLDVSIVIEELYNYLTASIEDKFNKEKLFYNHDIVVSDRKHSSDARYFIKLSFDTLRKSKFYYFINIKPIGNQIVVTNIQYIKSSHDWYHALLFIMAAPFHYWSWIYHKARNNFSIDSQLGGYFYGNSFDLMDLEAYIKASNFIILRSIKEFAVKNGLLTEELRQLIVNNINNTQNISIKKSKGIKFGKLQISNTNAK